MKFSIKALIELATKGGDKAVKETKKIADNLGNAAKQAKALGKNLVQTATGKSILGHMGPGESTAKYRTERAAAGNRGAAGRNFSGLARLGGTEGSLVGAYAAIAANVFALTAAFQRLSDAAKVEQLTRGIEIMGARGGVALKLTAKNLQDVTDNAISAADALRSTAQAVSAGLSSDEIERLGRVAKGASLALGRDTADSLDRLTRGAIKLEPELLDELGIMVRLDQAARDYAIANHKAVSALTLTEKRQAFLNAVLKEGETKFGSINEQINSNPYDKLSASMRQTATEALRLLNKALEPLVKLFTNNPILLFIPAIYLLDKALKGLGLTAKLSKANIEGLFDKIVDIRDKKGLINVNAGGAQGVFDTVLTDQVEDPKTGRAIQIKTIDDVKRAFVLAEQEKAASLSLTQRGILQVKKSMLLTSIQARVLASSILAVSKAIAASIVQLLVFTLAFAALSFVGKMILGWIDNLRGFTKEKKELVGQLKEIVENSAEVEKQMNKAFKTNDYSTAFTAVINNIVELTDKMEELANVSSASASHIKNGITTIKDPLSDILYGLKAFDLLGSKTAIIAGQDVTNNIDIFSTNKTELRAQVIALRRIQTLQGKEYAQTVAIRAEREGLTKVLIDEGKKLEAIKNSYNDIKATAQGIAVSLSKFYGEDPFKSNYTEVAAGIKGINIEIEAMQKTVTSANFSKVMAGVFDDAAAAGQLFSGELDRITNNAGFSNLEKQINDVNREIRTTTGDTTALQKNLDNLKAKWVDLYVSTGAATKAMLESVDQLSKKTTVDAAKNLEQLYTLQLKIVETASKINADTKKASLIRRLGTDKVPNFLLQRDEIKALDDKIKMEQALAKQRIAVIDSEYELLKAQRAFYMFKMRSQIEQAKLEATPNSNDLLKQGLGKGGVVGDLANRLQQANQMYGFTGANKFLEESKDLRIKLADALGLASPEVNQYTQAMEGILAAVEAQEPVFASIHQAQIDTANQTVDALKAQRTLLVALEEAYLSESATNMRNLEIEKEKLTAAKELLSITRSTEDLKASTNRFNLGATAARKGISIGTRQEITLTIADKNTVLERLRKDEADRQAAFANQISIIDQQIVDAKKVLDNAGSEAAVAQATDNLNGLLRERADATSKNTAEVINSAAAVTNATAEIAQLNATMYTLSDNLRFARENAKAGLASSKTGFTLGIVGAKGIFDDLVAQEAQASGRTILDVLQDPASVQKIKETTMSIRKMNIEAEGLATIADTIGSSFTDAFSSIVDGTKSAKQAFVDMAISILKSISDMIIKMMVFNLVSSAFGGFGGGAPTFSNGQLTGASALVGNNPIPRADGGYMRGTGLQGLVNKPTYVVGEGKDTEAVVPLPNGRSIPVQMYGGSSSNNNVVVNVNLSDSGAQTQTQGPDMANLGQAIAAAVQRELVAQKAPGGLLSRYGT